MMTPADASLIFFGQLMVLATYTAKVMGLLLEMTPPFKAFAAFTEPLLKVHIAA